MAQLPVKNTYNAIVQYARGGYNELAKYIHLHVYLSLKDNRQLSDYL